MKGSAIVKPSMDAQNFGRRWRRVLVVGIHKGGFGIPLSGQDGAIQTGKRELFT